MPKMVNNSVVNVPFYQEKRKNGARSADSSNNNANNSSAEPSADSNEHFRKIFVGGLSINTTTEMMRLFFSQFGQVADAVVMRDPISNRSRGFGFVTYAEPEAVENVQRARPHIIDNKTVDTKRAFPRHEFIKAFRHLSNIKTNKIFLGGLKDCHDEASLRDYFRKFGNVTSVKVLLDKDTGRKRGFGFLEFEDTAAATRALAQGKHSINLSTVEVKTSTQMADSSKRIRLPIGGAAFAGYAPPQPTIMDHFVYNANYNPYQAQTSLPPSAFFNGWASYVAPTVPSSPYTRYPRRPSPVSAYAQAAGWPQGSSPYRGDWPANNYGPLAPWPLKGGPKHGPMPSAMMNERPKNEYKSVQAEEATKQKVAKPSTDDKQAEAGDVEKKWLAKDYKVFKPSGKYNLGSAQTNHITSLGNDGSTPTYGI